MWFLWWLKQQMKMSGVMVGGFMVVVLAFVGLLALTGIAAMVLEWVLDNPPVIIFAGGITAGTTFDYLYKRKGENEKAHN